MCKISPQPIGKSVRIWSSTLQTSHKPPGSKNIESGGASSFRNRLKYYQSDFYKDLCLPFAVSRCLDHLNRMTVLGLCLKKKKESQDSRTFAAHTFLKFTEVTIRYKWTFFVCKNFCSLSDGGGGTTTKKHSCNSCRGKGTKSEGVEGAAGKDQNYPISINGFILC